MSETVHYRGIATKVVIPEGKTLLNVAEDILKEHGKEVPAYCDNALEGLISTFYHQYFTHKDILYKLEQTDVDVDDDIIDGEWINPDKFRYELRYYNGGAGLEECLEEAMDNASESPTEPSELKKLVIIYKVACEYDYCPDSDEVDEILKNVIEYNDREGLIKMLDEYTGWSPSDIEGKVFSILESQEL